MLNFVCVGGRYTVGFACHVPTAITATLSSDGATVTLRIDDENHPDRWEVFVVDIGELREWLEQQEHEDHSPTLLGGDT